MIKVHKFNFITQWKLTKNCKEIKENIDEINYLKIVIYISYYKMPVCSSS